MPKSHIELIQGRVDKELLQGSTIDVYQLASAVHDNCPGLSLQAVADMVSMAVVTARGSAFWDRKVS